MAESWPLPILPTARHPAAAGVAASVLPVRSRG